MASRTRVNASFKIAGAAIALWSSAAFVQAEVIKIDLSPSGSSAAVGLSPANEVPANASTGSGNAISGGLSFDTDTSTLTFAIGYGSAVGFTDLTGAATGMHIHAGAAGANGPVLFDLAPVHFASVDPTKGGVIFGSVVYTAEQAADLLAGLNYVNIHTATNPGGEIRGQLIPDPNDAPVVACPANATVECGESVTYTATVTDADGDAVEVVWSLNGEEVQVDQIPAASPTSGAELEYTGVLPEGVNTLTVTATDSEGAVISCSSTITVADTTPPVIVSASVNPKELWPVNHKMVPVRVSAVATDTCGEATWKIISITSSETEDAKGSGNTAPDWQITGDATANLRAERSGTNKAGRVYTIAIQATDEAGNVSEPTTLTVTVPHSKGKGSDKGQSNKPR
jgi:hypothetical protein